jgi:hypothetical protein
MRLRRRYNLYPLIDWDDVLKRRIHKNGVDANRNEHSKRVSKIFMEQAFCAYGVSCCLPAGRQVSLTSTCEW